MNEDELRDLLPTERPLAAGRRRDMKERLMDQIDDQDKTSRNAFRLAVGAAAAGLVMLAGVTAVLIGDDDGGGPATDDTTPATEPPTTPPPATTTTAPPPASTTTTTPADAAPSVRDVDFANRTYARPCPSLLGDRDATLDAGSTFVDTGPEQGYVVELADVGYVDVDGDGTDEAVVALFCHHQRAESSAAWVGVFGVDANGDPQPVGTPLVVDFGSEPAEVDGRQVTIVEPGGTAGPDVEHVWEFDGNAFRVVSP